MKLRRAEQNRSVVRVDEGVAELAMRCTDGRTSIADGYVCNGNDVDKDVKSKRVLLVCSAGGHLAQLLRLRPWWETYERQWVTFDKPDAREALVDERVSWGHFPTTRSVPNLIHNMVLARHVLAAFQPDVIISNGAGIALPFFVFAAFKGIPTAYIEVYDRVDSRSLTGRLCQPLTDLFCVQWPALQRLYPSSVLIDPLY